MVRHKKRKTHQILEKSHFVFGDLFLCCLRRICKLQPVVDVCTWDVRRCVMPMPGLAGPYICGPADGFPAVCWRRAAPTLDKGVARLRKAKVRIMPKNNDEIRDASSTIVRYSRLVVGLGPRW